jgi:hypothetical protein
MADKVYIAATNSKVNATVLIMLAVYLGAVIWQGNVGAFASSVWADFSGQPMPGQGPGVTGQAQRPAFWQWALAVLILYWLAQNPSTENLFGPLLAIVIVAMLIQLAIRQPGVFQTMTNSFKSLLGGT